MTRGRAPRILALLLGLALVGVGGLAAGKWREIAGRYWLWRAVRTQGPSDAIARAASLLGTAHPALVALLQVEAGDLRLAVDAPAGPVVGRSVPAFSASIENVSRRTLVLFGPAVGAAVLQFEGGTAPLAGKGSSVPATSGVALGPGERLPLACPRALSALPGPWPAPGTAAEVEIHAYVANRTLLEGIVSVSTDGLSFTTTGSYWSIAVASARQRLEVAPEEKP